MATTTHNESVSEKQIIQLYKINSLEAEIWHWYLVSHERSYCYVTSHAIPQLNLFIFLRMPIRWAFYMIPDWVSFRNKTEVNSCLHGKCVLGLKREGKPEARANTPHLYTLPKKHRLLPNQIWAVRSLIFMVTWHFHALHSKSVARMLIAVFCCFVDGFEGEFNLFLVVVLLRVFAWASCGETWNDDGNQ